MWDPLNSYALNTIFCYCSRLINSVIFFSMKKHSINKRNCQRTDKSMYVWECVLQESFFFWVLLKEWLDSVSMPQTHAHLLIYSFITINVSILINKMYRIIFSKRKINHTWKKLLWNGKKGVNWSSEHILRPCAESPTHMPGWLGNSWLLIVGAIWPHPQQQRTNSPQQQICRVPECALYTQNRACPFRRHWKEPVFFLSFSFAFSLLQTNTVVNWINNCTTFVQKPAS